MKVAVLIGALVLALAAVVPAHAEKTAAKIKATLDVATPKVLANIDGNTAFVKVGLIGTSEYIEKEKSAANVALVIDCSGSMTGGKLDHAKEAALMFLERLQPDDILSVVTYASVVEVAIPATKVGDGAEMREKIRALGTRDNTALFAGVSKGAAEVRKFLDVQRVNRVILLSDGLANVGPSSPAQLGELGKSLRKEGVSVSTIGLGLDYNEDLMDELARASDGASAFAEQPQDVAKFFDRELRSIKDVIASDIKVELSLAEGFTPIRAIGFDAVINGQTVTFDANQLYNDWENFAIVEVKLPKGVAAEERQIATSRASWKDIATGGTETASAEAKIVYTEDATEVTKATHAETMSAAVRMVTAAQNRIAVSLRDQGKVQEAVKQMEETNAFIVINYQQLGDEDLNTLYLQNSDFTQQIQQEDYNATRKLMQSVSQGDVWRVKQ